MMQLFSSRPVMTLQVPNGQDRYCLANIRLNVWCSHSMPKNRLNVKLYKEITTPWCMFWNKVRNDPSRSSKVLAPIKSACGTFCWFSIVTLKLSIIWNLICQEPWIEVTFIGEVSCVYCTPWVKKGDTILLSISLLIDRFSQFFHRRTQLELCNKIINKDPTSPQMCCYTTLWNVPTRQCTGAQGTRDNQAAATGDACIHLTWSVASE